MTAFQVPKSTYFEGSYLGPPRFASYAYQLREIIGLQPSSVLEIGIGNGLVSYFLKRAGYNVVSLDIDTSLDPDITGSVAKLPLRDSSFDIACCFEVLEHLPYGRFSDGLAEICRVCRRAAILSLPDANRCYYIGFRLPKIGARRFVFELPRLKCPSHRFDGEHYWEIGKKGFSLQRIRQAMSSSGFRIRRTYRPFEVFSHRFFVLDKIHHTQR